MARHSIKSTSNRERGSSSVLVVAFVLGLVMLMISALALFGRHVWSQRDGNALAQARQAGIIRIGYAVEAPYAFITPTGKVTGQSPEIARVIAARLGIPRVEWRLTDFGDLIAGLKSHRFDVIAAGMYITPARQRQAAFSLPTFQACPALLVRKGNPLALHSYADLLHNPHARVAVISGAVEESRLRQLGMPEQRIIPVPDALSGRVAVRSGEADALALTSPTIRWMVMNPITGMTEMAKPFKAFAGEAPPHYSLGGFTFRKEDTELRQAWNAELAKFIGSAEHRRIVSAFGFTDAELPPKINPATIISRR